MNSKQLDKRRELYAVMMKITELQPWDIVPEDLPLVYTEKDGQNQVIFNIMGAQGAGFGVVCFPTFYDYICFRGRMKTKNTKREPVMFMDKKFLCVWGDREDVDKENKALIKELGYKFRGKDGWLFFNASEQRCLPRFLTEKEAEFLCGALGNLWLMLRAVCEEGLKVDFEKGETVFRSFAGKGKWINYAGQPQLDLDPITLTEETEDIKAIAALPKGDLVIELDERCLPMPCRENGTKIVFFPLIVTAVDSKTGSVLASRILSYKEDREDILFDIIADLSEEFGKVKQIKINDKFTRAALMDFCKKTDIKLNYQQKPLKNIDRLMEEMNENVPMMSLGELVEPGETAAEKPKGREVKGNGKASIARKEDGAGKGKCANAKKKAPETYVISVSLGTGCYRHIKISGDCTLEELHSAILDAFGFEDDHAHVFFLDNRAWLGDGYYSMYIEDEKKYTCDFALSDVLEEKQKFLYIFDFGDEWRFSCRVLRLTDEECGEPEIIRTAGEAPEQYPVYDEY